MGTCLISSSVLNPVLSLSTHLAFVALVLVQSESQCVREEPEFNFTELHSANSEKRIHAADTILLHDFQPQHQVTEVTPP